MVEFWLRRRTQHQSHAAAIEKSQVPSTEQMLQTNRVAIKLNRPVGVVNINCDLANPLDPQCGHSWCCHSCLTLPPPSDARLLAPDIVSIANSFMQAPSRSDIPPNAFAAADRLHSAAIHLLRGLRRHDRESGIGPAQLSALSV